jgi:hypothetical protein
MLLNAVMLLIAVVVDQLDFDLGGVQLPVVDAFLPRKAQFGRLDCSLATAGRTDHDRPLTAAEEPLVARNFV